MKKCNISFTCDCWTHAGSVLQSKMLIFLSWRHRRQRCHPLNNVLLKIKSLFALKIDLQLVLFHSICRTLWACPQRDGELCIFFVCYVVGVCGGVWKRFTRFPRSHWSFFPFFFPCLSSVSQPCPHYPFLSSVMVQGLLNTLSPRTKFRKCSLSPRLGLMTASTSHCASTSFQSPWLFWVLTQRIVKEELLLRHIIIILVWACSFVCMSSH